MSKHGRAMVALVVVGLLLGPTWALAQEAAPGEASPPAGAPPPAEAAPPPAAEPPAAEQPAEEGPSATTEALIRVGRIEMVLIQNEDPISALEFAQEAIEQDGESGRIRMLMAACAMAQDQPADAIEHYVRAIRLSEETDPITHLHSLYGLARALQRLAQLEQAAEAYEHYVAYAQAHPELESFVEIAQRLAAVLRARAAASNR